MTSTIGIPIKLLNEAQGHIVTLEITSGQTYRGKLIEAEDNMNVQLKDITVTARDGRVSHLEQVYIRGSHVRFFIVPDMLRFVSPFGCWELRLMLTGGIGMHPCSEVAMRAGAVSVWRVEGRRLVARGRRVGGGRGGLRGGGWGLRIGGERGEIWGTLRGRGERGEGGWEAEAIVISGDDVADQDRRRRGLELDELWGGERPRSAQNVLRCCREDCLIPLCRRRRGNR